MRCFDDENVIHVEGSVDPIRDIETIDTELMLADLQSVESMKDKAARNAKSGDKDAKEKLEVLTVCYEQLNKGKPLRELKFNDPHQQEVLKSLMLLSSKRVMYVANVDENNLEGNAHVDRVKKRAADEHGEVVVVCAKLESELAELNEADRAELLTSVGLKEPALNVLARAAYKLLGLQSYFTAGEKEIRAWTIPVGATAPQSAGVIHTDFERGFIRAEVYSLADLETYKSEKGIRDAGKLRVEGKSYVMHDGDICHFLFNV